MVPSCFAYMQYCHSIHQLHTQQACHPGNVETHLRAVIDATLVVETSKLELVVCHAPCSCFPTATANATAQHNRTDIHHATFGCVLLLRRQRQRQRQRQRRRRRTTNDERRTTNDERRTTTKRQTVTKKKRTDERQPTTHPTRRTHSHPLTRKAHKY